MIRTRRSGILLHPTSLPGPYGIGDIGPAAIDHLDWMQRAGQTVWQILPLGPTGLGNAPYNASSAFAGNPLLISPELLEEEGLLPDEFLRTAPALPAGRVDYATVIEWKERLLRGSWSHLQRSKNAEEHLEALNGFTTAESNRAWLDDWTLFAALRHRFDKTSWQSWPRGYRLRDEEELRAAREELADEIRYQAYVQFLFFRQWARLHAEATLRGISILGDLPIYVGLDSADVWAHPDLFDLDENGRPRSEAGVPPDAFSDTGQLWGNPLYRWDRLEETGFRWWVDRVRASLVTADAVRLDHFRGFAGYWSVPAGSETAVDGEWVDGPGMALFDALRAALGELPLVAEDLGVITDDVHELRRALGIPSMRVLQFGFGDACSNHLPHNLEPDCVLYTGTHDNSTVVGWFEGLEESLQSEVAEYAGGDPREIHWQLIRLALTSVADTVVVPLQDALGLGDEARMNLPGEPEDNWEWRLSGAPGEREADRLRSLVELTGRLLPGEETTVTPRDPDSSQPQEPHPEAPRDDP